jgi:DNA-binding HxlR family transcriptional regulator
MRDYDQYCAMARGLQIIGDRWTLLVVRELLLGDRRFTDLVDGLPGIPRNLLSSRLHDLKEVGLIEQVELAPPTPVTLYRLTPAGTRLEETVLALTRWGTSYLGVPDHGHRRGAWLGLLISAWRRDDEPPIAGELEVRLDDETFFLVCDPTGIRARYRTESEAAARLTADWPQLYQLLVGTSTVEAFLRDETTTATGDPEFLRKALAWIQPNPKAPQSGLAGARTARDTPYE